MAEIILAKSTAPGTPPTGYSAIYVKADGLPYVKDDAGVESPFTGVPGPTGPTGATGATGATGPQGPQGDPGTGTVNSVSVVTANGISATVANPTTTPALTFNAIDEAAIIVPTNAIVGSPTDLTTLERQQDHMWSAGVTDGALLTDNGDGTVNLGASNTMLRKAVATTITRSGSTATGDTTVAHLYGIGDLVTIEGAVQTEYNGTFVILTVPTASTFTYTVTGTPATPATGTILSAAEHTTLFTCAIAAQGPLALTDNSVNYIYADWNGGAPNYSVTTALTGFNCLNKCIAYTIVREGTSLHWVDARQMNVDSNRKDRRRLFETQSFQHVLGGSAIGESGTRNVSLTAGAFYYAYNRIAHPAFDTSGTDVFEYYYRNGVGGWTAVASATQINNTQYDDGSGALATLSNNNYGAFYVYLILNSPTIMAVQYGQGNYATVAAAQAAAIPTAPPSIQGVGVLVGRIIIQKSAAVFADIASAFLTTFASASAVNHNNLAGLQGGTLAEYYHLTSAEYTGTGTGAFVRTTSPTLVTPTLGVATATSINKVAITAPATSATLTVADGKTLIASNSLTFAGTDGTTITFQATDTYVGRATTDTLTNKRVTMRVGSTTSSATPTINTDNVDIYELTAQTEAITSFTTNLSGTPTSGQGLIIRVTGTAARAITWGASFEASTVALPTTTVTTAMLTIGFMWNSVTSKWRCVGVA